VNLFLFGYGFTVEIEQWCWVFSSRFVSGFTLSVRERKMMCCYCREAE
jgi:hypothetical protein